MDGEGGHAGLASLAKEALWQLLEALGGGGANIARRGGLGRGDECRVDDRSLSRGGMG